MSTTSTSAAPQKSNIRKLAEYIYSTGRSREIMAALEIVLSSGAGDTLRAMGQKQEGGESV